MGVGAAEGLCFDLGFLGDRARLLQCVPLLLLKVLGDAKRVRKSIKLTC